MPTNSMKTSPVCCHNERLATAQAAVPRPKASPIKNAVRRPSRRTSHDIIPAEAAMSSVAKTLSSKTMFSSINGAPKA